ncbi:pyrimidine reductase family protein [Frigoribacterium sp. PhB24]|uniref:pyrimidine reductase family protein n=1 Tax=Frigoribacterium sp. PhB24 TaxID=2485204 RepID=UPI000FA231B7|nr:pyrimidine reductase family protein [Frigoribacterium sp. PhB24]ROS54266.1 riboflavin biosynthesis pyrimidine reductase [Frigoribacterium sp. PhB24]
MTDTKITRLHPAPPVAGMPLTVDDLVELHRPRDRQAPRVRANFVASVDGSATAAGRTRDLGGPADLLVFDLLRRLCDVVVVGAGTVRDEGYGPMRLADDAVAWRREAGLPDHPGFAIVSSGLDLDPTSAVFTEAPVRPLVLTHDSAPRATRARLDEVADVVSCGSDRVDPHLLVRALVERGSPQIHTEGGPTLLGDLVAADVVDELCLTVSPNLEGGAGPRIVAAREAMALRGLALDHVLLSDDMLLTKWSRRR